MTTTGRWFGADDGPSFGWLTTEGPVVPGSGVLVLPPLGYEWWSGYRTLRELAERLAAKGHAVLRLHYLGNGNAGGAQRDVTSLEVLRSSVKDGADELRRLGCEHLTLAGVRLGGTLALQEAAVLGAQAAIAWQPVVSGRRYARELRLRSVPVPEEAPDAGALSLAGALFGAGMLADLARVDLMALESPPPRALVVDGPGAGPLVEHLRSLGADVEHTDLPGAETALAVSTEVAVAATEVVAGIAGWVGEARDTRDAGSTHDVPSREPVVLPWGEGRVLEEVVQLGPQRFVGVRTSPSDVPWSGVTLLLVNPGSEPHVGPGRAWVELARDMALCGHQVIRADFRGWGESPDDELAPGRPFDPHAIDDAAALIRAVREREGGAVVAGGLCAGAWVALRAVLAEPAEAVIALNPPMMVYPGHWWEPLPEDAKRRRAPDRAAEVAGRLDGSWDELDRRGERNFAGRWLDDLHAAGIFVTLIFAQDDDGQFYLENRLARRVAELTRAGSLEVLVDDEIDHPMHRTWRRPHLFATIEAALSRTAAVSAASGATSHRSPALTR